MGGMAGGARATSFKDFDYIKHSFCIMGKFVSAYSSHNYSVRLPKYKCLIRL